MLLGIKKNLVLLHALIFFNLIFSLPILANSYKEEALTLSRDAEKQKLLYLDQAQELRKKLTEPLQETLVKKNVEQKMPSCKTNLSKKEYLIFVSLSMPNETLKSLYQEAETDSAILVLRGLKDQSFKKTGEHLKELGIGLQIDPELFKKYQIQKVPTFVRIRENEYDSLAGNVSFQFAKQKFLELK